MSYNLGGNLAGIECVSQLLLLSYETLSPILERDIQKQYHIDIKEFDFKSPKVKVFIGTL